MGHLEPLTPVDTVPLYPALHRELLRLIRRLDADDWLRPTVAKVWRVRDVAMHLLDGDLRRLSAGRDRHRLDTGPVSSYADVVALIQRLNTDGVRYGDRLSPRLLSDLLEVTGRWVSAHMAELPPHDAATFAVAWAGESRSEHWMDIGRDYTERWHHQMQIRDAVGAPLLLERVWLQPLLDLSVRAFPRAYRDVAADVGAAIVFSIRPADDMDWSVIRDAGGWVVQRGVAAQPVAQVQVDADTAWRLLYNALAPEDVHARVVTVGDRRLVEPMLAARSVMV